MKFNSFFVYGALSAVAVAAIGWSVWSTKAVAQDAAIAVESADAANPDENSATVVPPVPMGSELKPTPSNRASQLAPAAPAQHAQSRTNPYSLLPTFDPYSTSAQAPAQAEPAPPISLPGPPVYHDPNRRGVMLPLQAGTYSVQVRETDIEAVKRIEAYQQLQAEINKLLQRRNEPKGESQWSELRQQIVEATAKQFDLRQQLREREIEQLKERLAEVESTVASRNKLKNEIVEKRVADILREPDRLQWEPLSNTTAPNGTTILPPSSGATRPSYVTPEYPIPAPPARTYVPRTVTRIQRNTTVDANGVTTVVETPVTETEYAEVEPTRIVPFPGASTSTRLASPSVSTDALGDRLGIAPTGLSVAEAKARVGIAELKREQGLRRTGNDENDDDVKRLTAELELAKVQLTHAQAEYQGRTKLRELDVRRAESVCEQAIADLTRTQELNKRVPNTISSTQIAKQEATVEQARIELERAKTLLEIHQKSNAPQVEEPQVAR